MNEKFDLSDRSNILMLILLGAAISVVLSLLMFGGALGASVLQGKMQALPYALGLLGLVLVGAGVWLASTLSDTGGKVDDVGAQSHARTQEAILRLLDEMSLLADGDLTLEATVTEDITGAIADSVNYTVEALRDLVKTINETATELSDATGQTQAISSELVLASERQSNEILETVAAVKGMISSTGEVSASATQAATEAEQSLDVAAQGGDAVRSTIDGMTGVRDQIQETSKRIKRLGESSQEIGNIVELINDIAEQTNTQALNASIQAAMAGDAGRGFAVVAAEVQRLAERAAIATRQIENLVRTIQADTSEATVSMERTISGVVSGTRLAENAGSALIQIEQSAGQIAERVRGIAAAAQQQAVEAGSVSETIESIRAITELTSSGTRATGDSISRLTKLADELRTSVSGFKLPA